MKTTFLILSLLLTSPFLKGYSQVTISGKKTDWTLVGSVPANTPFQIKGSGTVNFGCALNACKDGVNAGVTGNAFARWVRDNWGTIEELLLDLLEAAETAATALDARVTIKSGETFASYIIRKSKGTIVNTDPAFIKYINGVSSKVNYDEGGFWIVMTVDNQAPVIGQNTFCDPALYYWYNKLYITFFQKKLSPEMPLTKPVWIWVLPHDGGRNAINFRKEDYHDNSGSYKVWIQK